MRTVFPLGAWGVVLLAVAGGLAGSLGPLNLASPSAPAAASSSPSATGPATPSPPPASAQPSATRAAALTCPTAGFPTYGALGGGIYAVDPDLQNQTPCTPLEYDEVHASITSDEPDSGARWTTSLTLPNENGTATPAGALSSVYVGEVVKGDPNSSGGQSYLEVSAQPDGLYGWVGWNVTVAVLALNFSSPANTTCASGQETVSWEGSYWCERDDLGADGLALPGGTVPGGTTLGITFLGVVGGKAGLDLWVNDSSASAHDGAWVLDKATTGTYTFAPAFNAACTDLNNVPCWLNWSVVASQDSGWGQGFGMTLCPFSGGSTLCNSYNGTLWATLTPIGFGTPYFWTGAGYTGQYRYLATQSNSAVCATGTTLLVAPCLGYTSYGGTGFYPYYSVAATGLYLGEYAPGPNASFGGAIGQFPTQAPVHRDLTPLGFAQLYDSSSGGYLRSGPLTVTARLVDLGTVSSAWMNYSVNGSAYTDIALTPTGGSASSPIYSGSVPAGPNGKIVYYVCAENAVGGSVCSSATTVQRGPLPPVTVEVELNDDSVPDACLYVVINGTRYVNGQDALLTPGSYPLSAHWCSPYNFTGYTTIGGLSISLSTDSAGALTIRSAGTLTAAFVWVRPYVTLFVRTNSNCLRIEVNGSLTANGSAIEIYYGLPYGLVWLLASGCSAVAFSGWSVAGNLSVLETSNPDQSTYRLTADSNGTVTGNLLSTLVSYTLTFVTTPSSCGQGWVLFQYVSPTEGEVGYYNQTSLAVTAGDYAIADLPGFHYGFVAWATSGGLSVNAGNDELVVTGSGILSMSCQIQTLLTVETNTPGCGGMTIDGVNWPGGTSEAIPNGSQLEAVPYGCSGYYVQTVLSTPGVYLNSTLLTVRTSGTLTVYLLPGAPSAFVGFQVSGCGQVTFGSYGAFGNGGYVSDATPGATYVLGVVPCTDYGFYSWTASGEIEVSGGAHGVAWVNGSGSITATFNSVAIVIVSTSPSTCGAVVIAGVTYPDGSVAENLTSGVSYPISAQPCPYYVLDQYASSGATIQAGSIIVGDGGATLTAEFQPAIYAVNVTLAGSQCGDTIVTSTVKLSGTTISGAAVIPKAHGAYALTPSACAGNSFSAWQVTGGLTVVGATLFVNGTGNLTALFAPIPLTLTLQVPSGADVGITVTYFVVIPVTLPGSYRYLWTFGDGTNASTSFNSTSHVYARSGTYPVSLTVIDPIGRIANATGTISVVSGSSGSAIFTFTEVDLVVLLLLAGFLAAIVLVRWVRRPPLAPP